ncbi:MAG: DUF411 domain-containing protein [Burkholderiaceae bacterium]
MIEAVPISRGVGHVRQFVLGLVLLMMAALLMPGVRAAPANATAPADGGERVLRVFKSPTCGCCSAWVGHMRAAGYEVRAEDVSQRALNALKQRLGIEPQLASCHTALIDGRFVEGHVPAEQVGRMLTDTTAAQVRGLTVPGMPVGSPGMEMGARRDPYQVIAVGQDGRASVFADYP